MLETESLYFLEKFVFLFYILYVDKSVAIANEFLAKPDGVALTQMQLQKLVYIAHGWSLGLTGNPLTIEEPEAWDYGPVYPDLYDHTKAFGSRPIGRLLTPSDQSLFAAFRGSDKSPYRAVLTASDRNIIDSVWRRYGRASGGNLSSLTHRPNTPWSLTYRNGIGKSAKIANDVIKRHYQELAASNAGK